ncbi:MAG: GGDEF domain-containing protein [Myxococcota bacterium]|nr:GGDEF domain-containing protein [Myxococcota bacterium]
MSVVDDLTRLPTHDDGLCEELRHSGPLACLVDVDGLIWVNDQHGHVVGDRALATVAAELLQVVQPFGSVFRVGGDEFLVLLRDLDAKGVLDLAARIVTSIRALRIPYRRRDRPEATVLDVNVAIVRADHAFAKGAFYQHGLVGSARDWIGERVYREKLRVGLGSGTVVDLSSAEDLPWAEAVD